MELRRAGDLLVMLYEMEQAARFTCRNCDPKELNQIKEMTNLLRVDQSPLQKYIRR